MQPRVLLVTGLLVLGQLLIPQGAAPREAMHSEAVSDPVIPRASKSPGGVHESDWVTLCPGIERARFDACSKSSYDDSKITVVRVDPGRAHVRVLSSGSLGLPKGLRAEDWAERFDLALVVNAGMFAEDWRTHLGYLKISDDEVNSPVVRTSYKSALVLDPRHPSDPAATIVDLDGGTSIRNLAARYGSVVQNLRIIKSPGIVVWSQSPRKWSEAALGLDRSGRLLFIFCRSPYTMRDLGGCLLKLPLDLVAVQHLEGGGDAAMAIRTPALRETLVGSYESGANDGTRRPYQDIREGFPLPNVLAVSACR